MRSKQWLIIGLAVLLAVAMLAGCGGKKNDSGDNHHVNHRNNDNEFSDGLIAGDLQDGHYYAESGYDEKSGWKEVVALKVENGKIVDVNWNALHKDGGLDKKAASRAGQYGMVAKGGAQAEWHVQAERMEQYLLDKQSLAALDIDETGKTDAVSGVSVTVGEFAKLVDQALKAGPVQPGPYKDGTYYAEAADFDEKSGWKDTVQITVMNGNIVAVRWNAVHRDGGFDKVTRSIQGEYGMVENGGAQAEWHEQALRTEQYLLEVQDPDLIPYNPEDGKTDAISGVSIHVDSFAELAKKALQAAR